MSQRKSERLVNLTIALLATRRYVSKEQIRRTVEGYDGLSTAAFERTFERDKDELRHLGIPIQTSSNSALFDDEQGYRIPRADFELPPVDLTPDEATAVSLAARIWQEAALAEATTSALTKLAAAGARPEPARLASLAPSFAPGGLAGGPAFEALWQAMIQRRVVRFTYRDGAVRTLEPWLITFRRGAWYVTGRDVDKDGMRQFKLNRIQGIPDSLGKPDAFTIPDGVDAREVAHRLEPGQPDATALVAIRDRYAPALRRRGRLSERTAPWPEYRVYEIGYAQSGDFAAEVAAAGADAIVLEPSALREAVVARLRRWAEQP